MYICRYIYIYIFIYYMYIYIYVYILGLTHIHVQFPYHLCWILGLLSSSTEFRRDFRRSVSYVTRRWAPRRTWPFSCAPRGSSCRELRPKRRWLGFQCWGSHGTKMGKNMETIGTSHEHMGKNHGKYGDTSHDWLENQWKSYERMEVYSVLRKSWENKKKSLD